METSADSQTHIVDAPGVLVRIAGALLVAATWLSAGIFGVYILAAYGGALQDGDLERWNDVLPRLYEPGAILAAASIGVHFAAGAVLLLLGPVQLIGAVRRRAPAIHRWMGRIYVASAMIAGVGGLGHIALKGTIGGTVMDVGFGLYGALMLVCGAQTLRHAMARRIEAHRAWAIRLFALAIGSWLYRVEYGLWFVFADNAGHTDTFSGWFDWIMAFFFFVPNLLVAELFIVARSEGGPILKSGAALALTATAGLVLLSTYFFTKELWGPAIVSRFGA